MSFAETLHLHFETNKESKQLKKSIKKKESNKSVLLITCWAKQKFGRLV